ncbi:MAG: NfeD family protein [Betaproteobacteria bacterium]|nr:NfeD family protein [Betaproteobacteria bacterium]
MDLSSATLWWLLAAVLVALELATGTLYLLMLAVGAAVGAVAAHLGAGSAVQVAAGAVVAVAAVAIWHRVHDRLQPRPKDAASNRDVNLDVGEHVSVKRWDDDKTGRTFYRGSEWLVRYDGADTPQPGEHRIVALEGNRLIVKKIT